MPESSDRQRETRHLHMTNPNNSHVKPPCISIVMFQLSSLSCAKGHVKTGLLMWFAPNFRSQCDILRRDRLTPAARQSMAHRDFSQLFEAKLITTEQNNVKQCVILCNFVVEELEDLGWSASRIRAALVREGWLSAEKALDRLHSNPTCPNATQMLHQKTKAKIVASYFIAVCIARIIGLEFRYA